MKNNYYQHIDGWFDFPDFYDYAFDQFQGGVFAEIGVWKGRSLAYMAEKIKESGKDIKLYGIDTFEGSPGYMKSEDVIVNKTLYGIYKKNIEPLNDVITTIKGDSHKVYKQFKDGSIDFIFIDGDHLYEAIKKDIELWFPKVKIGGIISGHDYAENMGYGVTEAVNELFPENFKRMGAHVWYHEKYQNNLPTKIISDRGYYFDDREKSGITELSIVMSILKLFNVKTAIDIGCGGGVYSRQLIENGVDCIGFDGSPHTPKMTGGIGFVMDFSKPVNLGKFDLVLSLEVGEHIPAEYADNYLDNLCTHAKYLICVSWSPRTDPVFGHVNCQGNDYVIREMKKRNFDLDPEATNYARGQITQWNHFRDSLMIFKRAKNNG